MRALRSGQWKRGKQFLVAGVFGGGGGEAIAGALTEALKAALTNSQISVQIGMPT